ncbi:MAG: AAA family ATPase [Thermoanaerobaculia bacterium]
MSNGDQVKAVLISSDGEFRSACREILADPGIPVEADLEIARSFTEIGDPELDELRRADPGLIVVDLESDPHVGLLFIQYLVESGQPGAMVAAGRELSQELLLQAIQAGVTEVLAKPLDRDKVREALRRVLRKTGRMVAKEERRADPGHAITLFGAKGGVGTTTLATNLAVAIHRLTRQRTLLLDLDVELGGTGFLLGLEPRFSLLDLLRNFHRLDSGLLDSFIAHHGSGIEVLAAPHQPVDFDAVNGDRMRQVLGLVREHYDWVVIDRPRTFHAALHCILEDADDALLVTTPDLQALRNIVRSLPLIQRLQGSRSRQPPRLVVNRYRPDQAVTLKEIEETVGLEVFGTLRDDSRALDESINEGSPVVLKGSSGYGGDVRKLAGAVTGLALGEAQRQRGVRGIVGRFAAGRTRMASI